MYRSKLNSHPVTSPINYRDTKMDIFKGKNARKQNSSVLRFRNIEVVKI